MSNKAEARRVGSVAKDSGGATDRMGCTENATETDAIRSSLDLEEYEMENKRRGFALIFNQEHFADGRIRRGTNVDRDNLEKRLKKLNFEVKAYNDSTKETVLKEITKAAEADHSDADCFLLVFLSHGGKDDENPYVCAYDDRINIQDITSMFKGDKCKSLVGKPKIFILQACRGNKFDDPVTPCGADDSDEDEDMDVEDACAIQTLPAGADFIMCYSTAEGYYSIRHLTYGSWYIQDLCELLQYGESLEFTYLLTLVTRKVSMRSVEKSKGEKQLPCFASMLTKKLYFRPKNSTSLCILRPSLCCFSKGVCQPPSTAESVAQDGRPAADGMACTENLTETVSLIKRSSGWDPAEEYKMDNRQGLALILTLDETENNADCDNLEKRLNELNFNVKTYNNSNKEEVFNKITEAAEADHSDADCFLLIYLSYGNDDKTDDKNAQVFDDKTIQGITSLFKGDKCKSLVGKPKIFIFQASRGEVYDDPVTACSADEMEAEDIRPHTLPAGADFIICYSVAAGYSSHEDTKNGSWYIQDLCEMLQKYGGSLEFTELLTQVNRKVSMRSLKEQGEPKEKKQLPCFASMLTKKLYFRSKK